MIDFNAIHGNPNCAQNDRDLVPYIYSNYKKNMIVYVPNRV